MNLYMHQQQDMHIMHMIEMDMEYILWYSTEVDM